MGATTFIDSAKKKDFKSAKEAFDSLIKDAEYEYGHNPYSGTIATKETFEKHLLKKEFKTIKELIAVAEDLLDTEFQNLSKWDPAIMIECDEGWVFFGWAPD